MPSLGKRAVPAGVMKMQNRKRRKISGHAPDDLDGPQSSEMTRRDHSNLQWRNVSPSALDDFEGFFGLEEVDNVEVVRDEGSGKVTLKQTHINRSGDLPLSERSTASREVLSQSPVGEDVAHADDDVGDAWDGFTESGSDADSETHFDPPTSVNRSGAAPKSVTDPGIKIKALHGIAGHDTELSQSSIGTNANVFESLVSNSSDIEATDISKWNDLNLHPAVNGALMRLKFPQPTAIQAAAIPPIKDGRDLIGKAPTGSGKTLAFGIPILEHWLSRQQPQHGEARKSALKSPTALIILPTRELAHQIHEHFMPLCVDPAFDRLSIVTLTGGLSIQKQRRLLERADVIIATPGRLWELMSENKDTQARVQKVDILVIDEADRILSQGHFQEVEEILNVLDRPSDEAVEATIVKEKKQRHSRQTLLFSATMDRDLQQKLSKHSKQYSESQSRGSMAYLLKKLKFITQPVFVDVNPDSHMASELQEKMLEVPVGTDKDLYLYALLLLHRPYPKTRTLVFVNSIAAVRRLVPFLQNLQLRALPLHSQMEQKARLRSVERFSEPAKGNATNDKSSTNSVLVATDVAARGLDIHDIHLVVHYHLPRTADGYVHRSGRTARATASGTSVLMCAPTEAAGVRRLVAKVHAKKSSRKQQDLQVIDLAGKVISRLRPRSASSKRIADAEMAKEREGTSASWMAEAANDLGIDIDEELGEVGNDLGRKSGRGKQRRVREQKSREISRAEIKALKAEMQALLTQRVNTGVSERYLTSGNVDIDALLAEREGGVGNVAGDFLGAVDLGV